MVGTILIASCMLLTSAAVAADVVHAGDDASFLAALPTLQALYGAPGPTAGPTFAPELSAVVGTAGWDLRVWFLSATSDDGLAFAERPDDARAVTVAFASVDGLVLGDRVDLGSRPAWTPVALSRASADGRWWGDADRNRDRTSHLQMSLPFLDGDSVWLALAVEDAVAADGAWASVHAALQFVPHAPLAAPEPATGAVLVACAAVIAWRRAHRRGIAGGRGR